MADTEERPILDETDLKLIALLEEDGRQSNLALAQKLGVSQVTVASRLRKLGERGIAQVVGLFELDAAGFDLVYTVGITLADGASPEKIAKQLSKIEATRSVIIVDDMYDILLSFVAADREDVRDIAGRLQRVEGIDALEFHMILDAIQYKPEWALHL